jgi:hypothetical protein
MADEPEVLPAVQPPMKVPTGHGDVADGPTVTIDNRTELPDRVVQEAVMAHWVESAALQFGTPSSFQLYSNHAGNSMFNRSPFRVPLNIIDEMKLARSVAETDDDILAVIGQSIATAFGDGMQNQHEDEATVILFNKICGPVAAGGMNMDRVLKEMYREYLIAGQFTTISLFTRSRYNFTPSGSEQVVNAQVSTPLVGVLPSETIRVLSNDIFGNGELAYEPDSNQLKDWLDEFFDTRTTAARKNQMRGEQPVLAAVFTGKVTVDWNDQDMFTAGKTLYTLNPRMVHRTTMAKGGSAYARPPLTANFALLEAKRLLNIMDYALLQGGTNYIVVAKQGSDQLPAQQPEIDNLIDQVRSASRTGVLVGDHRLDIEIITPQLDELLNPAKRQLIGRKLAMALLRIPEQVTHDPGNAGAAQELEFTARSITSDRRDIKRHVEGNIYNEVASRNPSTFKRGAPSVWFPKIILSGVKDFYSSVLQARDRGDIPRKWSVETLGFDYEAGLAERRREKARGDDDILTPGFVPNAGTDGGQGRPPGSSSDNGRPGNPAQPVDPQQRQRPGLPSGVQPAQPEPVRAVWDGERTMRFGELTAALLEAHPDHTVGRVTDGEREAVRSGEVVVRAASIIVPVNPGYAVNELRAFRLVEGASVIVGQRVDDEALVAAALSFREPQFDVRSATEAAMRWGFAVAVTSPPGDLPTPGPAPTRVQEVIAAFQENPALVTLAAEAFAKAIGGLVPDITLQMPGEGPKEVIRDEETGAIIGTRPIPPVA